MVQVLNFQEKCLSDWYFIEVGYQSLNPQKYYDKKIEILILKNPYNLPCPGSITKGSQGQ